MTVSEEFMAVVGKNTKRFYANESPGSPPSASPPQEITRPSVQSESSDGKSELVSGSLTGSLTSIHSYHSGKAEENQATAVPASRLEQIKSEGESQEESTSDSVFTETIVTGDAKPDGGDVNRKKHKGLDAASKKDPGIHISQ